MTKSPTRSCRTDSDEFDDQPLPGEISPDTATLSGLRPFFGFYGGKWRDAPKHYDPPRHSTLVEPFAGSAGYAVRFADRDVILGEIDEVIYGAWHYLIHASAEEIRAIPDLQPDQTVADLAIPQEARWLVGFWLDRGASRPRTGPSAWMREEIRPGIRIVRRSADTTARAASRESNPDGVGGGCPTVPDRSGRRWYRDGRHASV